MDSSPQFWSSLKWTGGNHKFCIFLRAVTAYTVSTKSVEKCQSFSEIIKNHDLLSSNIEVGNPLRLSEMFSGQFFDPHGLRFSGQKPYKVKFSKWEIYIFDCRFRILVKNCLLKVSFFQNSN